MHRVVFVALALVGSCTKPTSPTKSVESSTTPSLGAAQAPQPPLTPAPPVKAEPAAAQPAAPDGNWQVSTMVAEMDNDKLTVIRLEAENRIVGFGGIEVRPGLIFRCKKHSLDAYVVTDTPSHYNFGSDGYAVRLKYDTGKPAAQAWTGADDAKALFSPRPRDLVEKIAKTEYFRFEFTPAAQVASVVVFKTRGFAKHKPALQDCLNYKPPKRPPSEDDY